MEKAKRLNIIIDILKEDINEAVTVQLGNKTHHSNKNARRHKKQTPKRIQNTRRLCKIIDILKKDLNEKNAR